MKLTAITQPVKRDPCTTAVCTDGHRLQPITKVRATRTSEYVPRLLMLRVRLGCGCVQWIMSCRENYDAIQAVL
jgi:hypothetical protein